MFITGTGCVSPQPTFKLESLQAFDAHEDLHSIGPVLNESYRLGAIEPDYKKMLPPAMNRRMGRAIKMGIAAGMAAIRNSGRQPDAIVCGTALGCQTETEKFLSKMIQDHERFLNPTPFIHSTHNTIAGQIAQLAKCYGYNNTYVHRGFSFESALLDGLLLIKEEAAETVLIGGVEEMTDLTYTVFSRLGLYRPVPCGTDSSAGMESYAAGGEGAGFFMLANLPGNDCYGRLTGMEMFPVVESNREIVIRTRDFIDCNGIKPLDIDLVILGITGDRNQDRIYMEMASQIFPDAQWVRFKHLCGEYQTSGAFALWLATQIIHSGELPQSLCVNKKPAMKYQRILIYNHYRMLEHKLILIQAE